MKLTYRWLKDFVDCTLSPQELSESLTMAGIEVEAVEKSGEEFSGIVTGKILSLRPHGKADHLWVCDMELRDEKVPIVCGAPNLTVGDMVPVALPGAMLPNGVQVEKTRIRGELSVGMLCSAEELTLMDDTYGILQLDKRLKPGTPLAEALDYEDTVLELNITPNRGDCLSILGVAREVAAVTGAELRYPDFEIEEEGEPAHRQTSVHIAEPELCPRYSARIISGVQTKASPLWMQLRLKAAGMRPLNNIVDITNYVMLELGQPLHAFDFHTLRESRIVVRRARKGELLVTLDGKARTLDDTMLVIADAERSVALAGIMGGQDTEVSEESGVILLEAAHFDPTNNRRTSKKLGLDSEATYRFQRYVDPEGTLPAANRAAYLMSILAEGRVAPGWVDEWPLRKDAPCINIRARRTSKILGADLDRESISGYLRRLRFDVSEVDEDTLSVQIPSCRADLTREIDLVEEVARLYGYQNIHPTIPYARTALENPMTLKAPERLVRESLVRSGFMEIINYSFMDEKALDMLLIPRDDPRRALVRLRNPLNQDWSCMRTTMLPGLLQTILANFNRNKHDLKLFEVGRNYFNSGGGKLPHERDCFAAALTGVREQSIWSGKREEVDFFDLKGPLETALEWLRCERVKFQKTDLPCFDPLRSADVLVGGETVGVIGELKGEVLEAFDLHRKVVAFELDLGKIASASEVKALRFQPLPKFPPVPRDIALVLDRDVPAERVADAIREVAPQILKQLSLFDVYTGEQVPTGKKSLAFSLMFQSDDRTLLSREVDAFMEKLVAHLRDRVGAELR